MFSNKRLTCPRCDQELNSTEPTARPWSTRSSCSDSRPPGGSRSRSPHVPEQYAPIQVSILSNVVTPGVLPHEQNRRQIDWQRQTTSRCKIDWQFVNTRTIRARIAVLKQIVNHDTFIDHFKLLCVQGRMESFNDEDELLNRLQSLDTHPEFPPDSPQEREILEELKILVAEALQRRALLFGDVNIPGEDVINLPRLQPRVDRDR